MNIVLIETSGNQRYIFATNKLRENVGASELTYRVGTEFVLKAVEEITQKTIYEDTDLDGSKMRANLLDPEKNPELGKDGNKIEVITATSGKALLLVKNADVGTCIVRTVTKRALREMPGLTVHGAISKPFGDLAKHDYSCVHEAIKEVHLKLERIRYKMPSNEQRFLSLPFVAPCSTSGLPAHKEADYEPQKKVYSQMSCVKADNKGDGQNRIQEILKGLNLIDPEDIEKCAWTAVIHADGNGLGAVFLNFNQYAGFDQDGNWTGRKYLEDYRKFSLSLDICTIKATRTALNKLRDFVAKEEAKKQRKEVTQLSEEELEKLRLPVVPLVLGGDDLTVLCDGEYALKFTHDFLTAFEAETKKTHTLVGDIVKQIGERAFRKDYLGICAGIAIVKPHFPFHQAYELAESLLKSAKQVKQKISVPASALDFHVLYDSAYSELDTIREKLRVDQEKSWLYAKPYVVTDEKNLSSATDKTWFENRTFSELKKRIEAMRARDKDDSSKRALPNSQLHGLREALFLGSQEADARMKLIRQRYETLNQLLCNNSLFFDEKDGEKKERATHFMDALDIVEFWKGF